MAKKINYGLAVGCILSFIASIVANSISSPLVTYVSIFVACLILCILFYLHRNNRGAITEVIKKGLNYFKGLTSDINEEKQPFGLPFSYTLLKFFILVSGMIGLITFFLYIMSILPKEPEFDIAYIIVPPVCLIGYVAYCIRRLEKEGTRGKWASERLEIELDNTKVDIS
jgi:drug/metabolite transporter (DMT)-like permease